MERLWGLTEMFPDSVRIAAELSAQCSISLVKKCYRYVMIHDFCGMVLTVAQKITYICCSFFKYLRLL